MLGFAATAMVRGEEAWLQPERFNVTPGATFRVELATSEGFASPGSALDAAFVGRIQARLGDEPVAIHAPLAGLPALHYGMTVPRPGVAVVAVELKPLSLERSASEVETYLRAIHASDALRAAWAAVPAPARWRETTVRHAKVFVRVGEPPADERSWSVPVGPGLEIVPDRDPTALQAGESLPVRVMRRGMPVPGLVLAFVSDGETREHVTQTDENGRASAVLDVAGRWFVQGTELRRATAGGREWESESTTLMVAVRPVAPLPAPKST